MDASIICVGTELLLGDVVNTNAAYIAKELAQLGMNCFSQTVVGDNPQRLQQMLAIENEKSDIIITTGGLGPTYDDLTKETIAKFFKRQLVLHEPSLQKIVDIFTKMNQQMTENNKKQAFVPDGATVLVNDWGTAPGVILEVENKIIIMLPGPPRELKAMFEYRVKPYLQKLSETTIYSTNIHMFGIGESELEDGLKTYMETMTNPTIAPYAKDGEVYLRVTASSIDAQSARAQITPIVDKIATMYKKYIYGIDVDNMQTAFVQRLAAHKKTIAIAESCTGGRLMQLITEVSGCSEVFRGGICAYDNNIKINLLNIPKEIIWANGAVAEKTARYMARNIREQLTADFGLAMTGILGPSGGTDEKPVGLMYIALAQDSGEKVIKINLGRGYRNDRERIRYVACLHAMNLTLQALESHN